MWLNNAQDLVRNGVCSISEVIGTRDNIMVYLMYKGLQPKSAFKITEDVRKGRGLKPEYEEEMKAHDVPGWYIESCKKIKYMFPKAHAAAYVLMAMRIGWFKVYHPIAFYATYFTVRGDEFDAITMAAGKQKAERMIEELEKQGNALSARERNVLTILRSQMKCMQEALNFYLWTSMNRMRPHSGSRQRHKATAQFIARTGTNAAKLLPMPVNRVNSFP